VRMEDRLRKIRTVKVMPDTRGARDQRYKVDLHIVEYRDENNQEYRKSFAVRRGEKPNVPESGSHNQLNALSEQHLDAVDRPATCPPMFKTYDEWSRYNAQRIDIISRNRSLRMQGKPLLPQPARCEPPPKRVVYSREPDGALTYEGTLREGEQVPEGLILKLEKY
jgi:hypothetical protein